MAKYSQSKGTVAGLRSIQKLGTLAVPVPLAQVPEENEDKYDILKPQIFSTDDWKSVETAVKQIFRKEFDLTEPNTLFNVHQNVRNILRSKTGTFLSDCYREWIAKEMSCMAEKVRILKGPQLLTALVETWASFYKDILPLLEAILHQLKPKGRLSLRTATLAAFRDIVFFAGDIEGATAVDKDLVNAEVRHLILILQNVNDCYPPSKNGLRIEVIAAKLFETFMGYNGLYKNGELVVSSSEPASYAKRRPSVAVGVRRISRPFSVQPTQVDTLNQMFKSALKHKPIKISGIKE